MACFKRVAELPGLCDHLVALLHLLGLPGMIQGLCPTCTVMARKEDSLRWADWCMWLKACQFLTIATHTTC